MRDLDRANENSSWRVGVNSPLLEIGVIARSLARIDVNALIEPPGGDGSILVFLLPCQDGLGKWLFDAESKLGLHNFELSMAMTIVRLGRILAHRG